MGHRVPFGDKLTQNLTLGVTNDSMADTDEHGSISIGGSTIPLHWKLLGETLHLTIDDQSFTIQSGDDLRSQVFAFLTGLSRSRGAPVDVQCCINCDHFQMSSMAKDMGRGQRGVCRNHNAMVEIMQSCDGHSPVVQ